MSSDVNKLPYAVGFVVGGVILISVIIAIVSIRAWGPEAQSKAAVNYAEATKVLWTPTPEPTPHPDEVATQVSGRRVLFIGLVAAGIIGLMAAATVACSIAGRHVRGTVEVEPQPRVSRLPGAQPVLIGSGAIFDPRFGSVFRVEEDRGTDLEQGRVVLGAGTDRVTAIAQAAAYALGKPEAERSYAEKWLIEQDKLTSSEDRKLLLK